MSPKFERLVLMDGSFIEMTLEPIKPDRWRPHGVRYRLAWVQDGNCRVLFDNHHGKGDHLHRDGIEEDYKFVSVEKLWTDFRKAVKQCGGRV